MAAKYKIIADELRNYMVSHERITEYKLPTEYELCEKYGVSRQTIRQALLTLEQEHLIKRQQGSGAFVLPHAEYLKRLKIVMLISEENEYIYPALISDLKAYIRSHNMNLTVICTKNDVNLERRVLKNLLTEHISLLIVEGIASPFPNPNIDLYNSFNTSRTQILFINHFYDGVENASFIGPDDINGGYLLGRQLLSRHLHKIWALLPNHVPEAALRFHGLQLAYRDSSFPIPSEEVFWYSKQDIELLRKRRDTGFLTTFIRHHAQNCDAVFCYNDEIAYWLIRELSYAKISVPGQIAVVSFDNSYLCTLSRPSISSLSLPSNEPANSICRAIIHLLEGNKPIKKVLPWEFISRSSTINIS